MDRSVKFWDRIATNYDKTEARFDPLHVKTIENTRRYLNASDVILDYGCATGKKALEMAGYVEKVHGMDISSKMIEIAKRRAGEQNIENVEFVQATIFDARYEAGSFDAVLAFNVLHAFKDRREVLRRINDLLKPGGWFISVTPCLGEKKSFSTGIQFSLFLVLSRMRVIPYVKVFNIAELDDSITGGDFQIVQAETFYHNMSSRFIAAKKPLRA